MWTRPAILTALLAATASGPAVAGARATFLYTLADGAGTMRLSWASMAWDARNSELYVVDHSHGVVDVFNETGMAIHAFGDDTAMGTPAAVASAESGEVFVLTTNGHWSLVRCNYRGEPLEKVELSGLPDGIADRFNPDAMVYASGHLYLADRAGLTVVVVDEDGLYSASYDLAALLKLDARQRNGADVRGFNVDRSGNVLATLPALFTACVVTPEGQVRTFGTRGSSPGKFNVISGIAADESGNLFVTDTLRAVVMVFAKDFQFLGEFGYRGADPQNLIAPAGVAVGNGRVFVSQSVGGVKVFAVRID
jgi:outer membrane protein assembly factor BamB